MPNHRAPAPRHPSRLWLVLMATACAGIVAGTVGVAHEVAPKVPERTPKPVAYGGPLAIPPIVAMTTEPLSVPVPSETVPAHNSPTTTRQARSGAHSGTATTHSAQPTTEATTWAPSPTASQPSSTAGPTPAAPTDTTTQQSASLPNLPLPTPSELPTSSETSTPSISPEAGDPSPAPSSVTSAIAPTPAPPATPSTGDEG